MALQLKLKCGDDGFSDPQLRLQNQNVYNEQKKEVEVLILTSISRKNFNHLNYLGIITCEFFDL